MLNIFGSEGSGEELSNPKISRGRKRFRNTPNSTLSSGKDAGSSLSTDVTSDGPELPTGHESAAVRKVPLVPIFCFSPNLQRQRGKRSTNGPSATMKVGDTPVIDAFINPMACHPPGLIANHSHFLANSVPGNAASSDTSFDTNLLSLEHFFGRQLIDMKQNGKIPSSDNDKDQSRIDSSLRTQAPQVQLLPSEKIQRTQIQPCERENTPSGYINRVSASPTAGDDVPLHLRFQANLPNLFNRWSPPTPSPPITEQNRNVPANFAELHNKLGPIQYTTSQGTDPVDSGNRSGRGNRSTRRRSGNAASRRDKKSSFRPPTPSSASHGNNSNPAPEFAQRGVDTPIGFIPLLWAPTPSLLKLLNTYKLNPQSELGQAFLLGASMVNYLCPLCGAMYFSLSHLPPHLAAADGPPRPNFIPGYPFPDSPVNRVNQRNRPSDLDGERAGVNFQTGSNGPQVRTAPPFTSTLFGSQTAGFADGMPQPWIAQPPSPSRGRARGRKSRISTPRSNRSRATSCRQPKIQDPAENPKGPVKRGRTRSVRGKSSRYPRETASRVPSEFLNTIPTPPRFEEPYLVPNYWSQVPAFPGQAFPTSVMPYSPNQRSPERTEVRGSVISASRGESAPTGQAETSPTVSMDTNQPAGSHHELILKKKSWMEKLQDSADCSKKEIMSTDSSAKDENTPVRDQLAIPSGENNKTDQADKAEITPITSMIAQSSSSTMNQWQVSIAEQVNNSNSSSSVSEVPATKYRLVESTFAAPEKHSHGEKSVKNKALVMADIFPTEETSLAGKKKCKTKSKMSDDAASSDTCREHESTSNRVTGASRSVNITSETGFNGTDFSGSSESTAKFVVSGPLADSRFEELTLNKQTEGLPKISIPEKMPASTVICSNEDLDIPYQAMNIPMTTEPALPADFSPGHFPLTDQAASCSTIHLKDGEPPSVHHSHLIKEVEIVENQVHYENMSSEEPFIPLIDYIGAVEDVITEESPVLPEVEEVGSKASTIEEDESVGDADDSSTDHEDFLEVEYETSDSSNGILSSPEPCGITIDLPIFSDYDDF